MSTAGIVKLLGAESAVALAGVLVLASGGLTPSTSAAAPDHEVTSAVRRTTTFGTLGIVDGQTVRLSAVRAGDDDPTTLCKVDLNLFDTQGDRQGAGVAADLQPRQAAFFDLSRADVHSEPGEARAQIYAVVDVTSDANNDAPTCHVAMSIEILDEDGRTQVYQGAFALSPIFREQKCCSVCCKRDSQGTCTAPCKQCVDVGQRTKCPTCKSGACVFQ
jgi:hypothetical protein